MQDDLWLHVRRMNLADRMKGEPLPDQLHSARKAIEDQLASLRGELQRLEAARAALDGAGQRRGPGRPRTRSASTDRTTSTRRRRSGGSTRSDQAYELVKAKPGITIPELAQRMGINQNYLYRVLPALQRQRKVTRRGKGWHAASSS